MIPSNDCDVDSTPAERLKSGRPSTSRVKSSGPMATLRVKTCEGTNHVIKMRYEDSVTTLRSYLQLGFYTILSVSEVDKNFINFLKQLSYKLQLIV